MNKLPTPNEHASAARPAPATSTSNSRQTERAHLLPAFVPVPSRPSAPPKRRVSLALPTDKTTWSLAPHLLPSPVPSSVRSPHPPSTPTKRKDDTLRKGYETPLSPRRAAAPYVPKARAVSGPGPMRPCTPPPMVVSPAALGVESPRLARIAKMRSAKARAVSGPGPSRPCTPPPSASAAMAISPSSLATESPRVARLAKMRAALGRSASGSSSRAGTPSSVGLERGPNQPSPCRAAMDKYGWLESKGSVKVRYDCVNLDSPQVEPVQFLHTGSVDSPRTKKMFIFDDEPLYRFVGDDINMFPE
ncbi:hypothetical protein HYPSUDRAFT_1046275 [Hypholoma sublateritium FD-334 SS-4]|uniref:Uncharacterized protein n=1 Tax=Hypholoma sublateritium (strain FD-334 SS-4) TaxID=945553 RepID=A0A0D2P9I1_HYPSF|nr:hypothetical protein HYPSUDRAFT_1046275 [Hypholoma sublateritium FD-334 SS-4]